MGKAIKVRRVSQIESTIYFPNQIC